MHHSVDCKFQLHFNSSNHFLKCIAVSESTAPMVQSMKCSVLPYMHKLRLSHCVPGLMHKLLVLLKAANLEFRIVVDVDVQANFLLQLL